MSSASSICSPSSAAPQISSTGASDNIEQWNPYTSTNKTPLEWSELPVPVLPLAANGSSTSYYITKPSNQNGFITPATPSSLNTNITFQRNGLNEMYKLNSLQTSSPQTPNGSVIIRPIPQKNTNGWINQPATSSAQYTPRPAGWTPTNKTGIIRKQKRIRTAFNSQQMMDLEREYSRNRYLDRSRRIELADALRLNERTIKIWFQNRRMKEKKDRAEYLEEMMEVSTSESSPELPMPVQQDPYLAPLINNGVYNHGEYNQQYMVPAPLYAPVIQEELPSMVAHNVNGYITYVKEEEFDADSCHISMQLQEYEQDLNNTMQEKHEPSLSEPQHDNSQINNDVPEANWDLSWIRSIHSE